MKIETAQVEMASQHTASMAESRRESLNAWVGQIRQLSANQGAQSLLTKPATRPVDRIELSPEMLRRLAEGQRAVMKPSVQLAKPQTVAAEPADSDAPSETDAQTIIAEVLLESLTGEEVKIEKPDIKPADVPVAATAATSGAEQAAADSARTQRAGWGVDYRYDYVRDEKEQTSFAAAGTVTTADGRQIDFALETEMSRSYHVEEHVSVQAGDAAVKDPLVLNFGGQAGTLTEERVQFDLNSDGQAEAMPFAGPGSGYLVYDRDSDGTVDNGSELLGPTTGDGFAELAALDTDKNGWLDEADPAYAQLKVWTRDGGHDTVSSLLQRQVGAIYVGSVATPFSVRDASNGVLGQVQESGVFLYEDGRAGMVQRVDVKV